MHGLLGAQPGTTAVVPSVGGKGLCAGEEHGPRRRTPAPCATRQLPPRPAAPSPRRPPGSSPPTRRRRTRCPFEVVEARGRAATRRCTATGRCTGRLHRAARRACSRGCRPTSRRGARARAPSAASTRTCALRRAGERASTGAQRRGRSRCARSLERVFEDSDRLRSGARALRARLRATSRRSSTRAARETVVVAPLLGLRARSRARCSIGEGLSLMRGDALEDAPADAVGRASEAAPARRWPCSRWEAAAGDEAPLAHARVRPRRLVTALRLYDRGGVGARARRVDAARRGGPWQARRHSARAPRSPTADRAGSHPPGGRAARVLQPRRRGARRAPARSPGRCGRFELGCDAPSALEALTDHLLALRALLEPEGAGERPARRPARRALRRAAGRARRLAERVAHAVALERARDRRPAPRRRRGVDALVGDSTSHLRALLRDVLCGHLDPDLRGVADALLRPRADRSAATRRGRTRRRRRSARCASMGAAVRDPDLRRRRPADWSPDRRARRPRRRRCTAATRRPGSSGGAGARAGRRRRAAPASARGRRRRRTGARWICTSPSTSWTSSSRCGTRIGVVARRARRRRRAIAAGRARRAPARRRRSAPPCAASALAELGPSSAATVAGSGGSGRRRPGRRG